MRLNKEVKKPKFSLNNFRVVNVTYWPSTELSIKRCTCVNNRCIRSKISGYHLDLLTGWIRCNCDAHRKQVDVKQLYNQVPQTAWVSCSSSCSSRQWEPAPDRGLGPSGPRLNSTAEWGRSAAIVRGTWSQYVAICSVSNSPLTDNQYQPFRNPFATLSRMKCERHIFLKKCVRSSLLLTMFPCIVVYVLCGYTTWKGEIYRYRVNICAEISAHTYSETGHRSLVSGLVPWNDCRGASC